MSTAYIYCPMADLRELLNSSTLWRSATLWRYPAKRLLGASLTGEVRGMLRPDQEENDRIRNV
jgi:hypothetical protein